MHASHERAARVSSLLSQFKTQVQEWKNTLLRGRDPAQLDRYWKAFGRIEQEMAADAAGLIKALPAGPAQDLVRQFADAHANMDREPARLLNAAVKQIAEDSVAIAERANAQAARATTLSLALMALWVLGMTIYQTFVLGVPKAEIMGGIGALALAANLASVVLLMRYSEGDANIRSVWLCSRNDAIGNVAVMIAALGVWGTTSAWPDLIVAAIMGSLFLSSSIQIVRRSRAELRSAATRCGNGRNRRCTTDREHFAATPNHCVGIQNDPARRPSHPTPTGKPSKRLLAVSFLTSSVWPLSKTT